MRQPIIAIVLAVAITAPSHAVVTVQGGFTFDYGQATPVMSNDPSSVESMSIASSPPFANFPITQEVTVNTVPDQFHYEGSFGGSFFDVTEDPATGSLSWDLRAESTVAGVRRGSSFLFSPVATVPGQDLDFTVAYDVEGMSDSNLDLVRAGELKLLIGYGSALFSPDFVTVIDEFPISALDFRAFDIAVVDEVGTKDYNLTKPTGTPDWIIRMQISASASDYSEADTGGGGIVPEPTMSWLCFIGLGSLMMRRRRSS